MKTAEEYLKYWGLEKALSGIASNEIVLKHYCDGEVLFHAGQDVDYAYLLVEGRCRLYGISREGKEVLVNYKEALGLYGEMEILLDVEFNLSLSAVGDAAVLKIPRKIIERKLLYQVDFLRYISLELANKMWQDSSKQIQAILKSGKERVAVLLCQQALAEGKKSFVFSCRKTALDAGISERQLTRVLGEWEENGIIKREGRKLRILDSDALNALKSDA